MLTENGQMNAIGELIKTYVLPLANKTTEFLNQINNGDSNKDNASKKQPSSAFMISSSEKFQLVIVLNEISGHISDLGGAAAPLKVSKIVFAQY